MSIKIYNLNNYQDTLDFQKLTNNKSISKIDTLKDQIEELYFIRHPQSKPNTTTPDEINIFIKELLSDKPFEYFGTWVYFESKNAIAHFLPEELHTELRTARNRNLITKDEQNKYYNSHVGITGLSVGSSALQTILHTGGSKFLRLADHDTLSGSNINRIKTNFLNINRKKIDIAVDDIYAVNPYAELELFPDGIKMDNLEKFLTLPKKLDLLIEEMDNLYLKIQIRLLARKLRIPIIMAADNGDNVVLDIERFDLEPDIPLFHGDISEKELLSVTPDLPKPEAAKLITRMVHPEIVAVKMQESLLELGKTLYSWPQLGTAAFLSGCVLAYTARKILINENIKSGHYLISLDEIIDPSYFSNEQIVKRNTVLSEFKKALSL